MPEVRVISVAVRLPPLFHGFVNGSPAQGVPSLSMCYIVVGGIRGIRSSLSLGDAVGTRGMRMRARALESNGGELLS